MRKSGYRCESGGRVRFAICYYREGRRLRQFFSTIEAAKKEALFVARRIQSGMQHITDLKPHERDTFIAARKLADDAGVPLIAALEDYPPKRGSAFWSHRFVIDNTRGEALGMTVRTLDGKQFLLVEVGNFPEETKPDFQNAHQIYVKE